MTHGSRERCHNNGRTHGSRCCTRRRATRISGSFKAFPLWCTPAEHASSWSPPTWRLPQTRGNLPEEQSSFRSGRPTVDMTFEARRLHELARGKSQPTICLFHRCSEAYDFCDQELLWSVPEQVGVPLLMLAAIRQFHHSTRARVQTNGRTYSG